MKKIISILLICLVLTSCFALCACNESEKEYIEDGATVCHFFETNKRIHIILQVAGKNPLLVGQVIVLQVFDDIHITILYNMCIEFCIIFNIYLQIIPFYLKKGIKT